MTTQIKAPRRFTLPSRLKLREWLDGYFLQHPLSLASPCSLPIR